MIRGKRPERYVVDASVALAYVWAEANGDAAGRLFEAARKTWVQLMAPDFSRTEWANGCWKRVQRRWKTADEVIRAMGVLDALPIAQLDTSQLHEAALGIAIQTRTSCYDALYVAAAQFADVPLVTADARLVRMLKDAAWAGDVFHISQW